MTNRKPLGKALGSGFDVPKVSGLGRGLSALLGDRDPDALEPQAVERAQRTLPIAQLKPNPFQPRRQFNEEELEDLTNSIKEKGILQPLIVRADPEAPNQFQIIAGERRWRAAQRARLHEVPVVIKEFSDAEALEIALIENVQRADLNAIEEARGYAQLSDKFAHSQDKIARMIGKSRSHVANTLRLLNLPQSVQAMITSGQLSAGHARTLINVPNPEALAREMIAGKLSVRAAETRTREAKGQPHAPERKGKDADTRALETKLSQQLGLSVAIAHAGDKGGTLTISYKTLEQLDDVCARLGRDGGF